MPESDQQLVEAVLRLVDGSASRPVLVGVDGRSGSGKTELADRLGTAIEDRGTRTAVVHLDDLYPGWSGLAAGLEILCEHVLPPLRAGQEAAYPSWDWRSGAPGPRRPVPDAAVVVVEGVGAIGSRCAHLLDVRVWLEAPEEVRRARALGRDGATFAPWWQMWAEQEERLLGAGRPVADLVLDTVTGTLRWDRLGP